jgi:unsaturated rhamnogalacturonyl hydrolase
MATIMRSAKFLALVFIVSITAPAQTTSQKPFSQRMADTVIARWPDGDMNKGGNSPDKIAQWAYDKNVVFSGMADLWQNTADPAYYRYIQRSMDKLVTPDGQLPYFGRKGEEHSLDEIALGRELLLMYGRTRKQQYYKAAQTVRQALEAQPRTPSGGFWHKQRYPNQMWLDGLYMAEPFYAQWAAMFHQPKDFDDIAHQFTLIEEHTRDPKTGLLYHGWDESKQQKWANPQTGASPEFWGRAVGWYAMALVDTLPYFPQDHPGRAQLIAILQRLSDAVVRAQDPQTGLWWEVMDKPKGPENYLESSASCMFIYALAKGVRLGYLDPKFAQDAKRGFDGAVQRFIKQDPDGKLTLDDTIYGAGLGSLGGAEYREGNYNYYVRSPHGPNDSKGVGAFLLAAAEMDLAPTATVARGTTVLLDSWYNSQKREEPNGTSSYFHYKWDDRADSGFYTFGRIFRSFGARTQTLDSAPRPGNLKNAQVYIIVSPDIPAKNPTPHYVEAADVKPVLDWVKAGGVLVLMENDSANSEFEHFNQLSEAFGIHFNAVVRNPVEGNKYEMGKIDVPARPPSVGIANWPFSGPHKFYMKEISTITPKAPAKGIVTLNGEVIMAVAKVGKGTIFAMTDPWLYNEYTDGIKLPPDFQNFQGGKELARWLLQQVPKQRAK